MPSLKAWQKAVPRVLPRAARKAWPRAALRVVLRVVLRAALRAAPRVLPGWLLLRPSWQKMAALKTSFPLWLTPWRLRIFFENTDCRVLSSRKSASRGERGLAGRGGVRLLVSGDVPIVDGPKAMQSAP